jgi:hypothetical protein
MLCMQTHADRSYARIMEEQDALTEVQANHTQFVADIPM